MKNIEDYSLMIENGISQLALPIDKLPGLYEPIYYGLSGGGKRLRPVLTLMVCDAFGEDASKALRPAIGVEMFHNFTLLHDDVMDKSDIRRGKPTVHRQWNESTAILSGDTMLTLATQLIMEVPNDKLRSTLDVFNQMAIDVYEGQQMDIDFETDSNVELDRYITMITGKTSALLGCAAEIGALIAGCNEEDCKNIYKFGVSLGLAFQIQDDYLDLYGDEATFGKPIGGDILNNKKTFLPIAALSMTDSVHYTELKEAMSMQGSRAKIDRIRNLFTAMKVPAICEQAIDNYSADALNALSRTSMSEEGKNALSKVVEKLIGRKK